MLLCLTLTRESGFCERQAGSCPGQGFLDQTFILRRLIAMRGAHYRLMIVPPPDFNGPFVSVDQPMFFRALRWNDVLQGFVNLF